MTFENIDFSEVLFVGQKTFKNCVSLTSINMPKLVGFNNTSGATTASEPYYTDTDTSAYYTFNGCVNLKTVFMPNVQYITNHVFDGCEALTDIDISSVKRIGIGAFMGCIGLTSLDLSNLEDSAYLTSTQAASYLYPGIYAYAFKNCVNLKTVTFGNYGIGERAFEGCTSLTEVDLSQMTIRTKTNGTRTYDLEPYAAGIFKDCTGLTSVVLSDVAVSANMFDGCTALSEVDFAKTTGVGAEAFKGCVALTEVDLSEIASIGANAFEGCTAMTSITITETTTAIGASAFAGWTAEQSISIDMYELFKPVDWSDDWNKDCNATITWKED
jgi:hypothetical protein